MTTLQVAHVFYEGERYNFPCVECGLTTGNFCDGADAKCYACCRVPTDFPEDSTMLTPFCTYCETLYGYCRFCRGVDACTPRETQTHWSGVPNAQSRYFDRAKADAACRAQWSATAFQVLRKVLGLTDDADTTPTLLSRQDLEMWADTVTKAESVAGHKIDALLEKRGIAHNASFTKAMKIIKLYDHMCAV